LAVDGASVELTEYSEHAEYEAIYARFADIISAGKSDVDLHPLKLVADAFLLGDRITLEPFVQ